MRKTVYSGIIFFICFILLFIPMTALAEGETAETTAEPIEAIPADINDNDIEAVSAILIEASTGRVLYEKNADAKIYPASTTKVMTALLILELAAKDEYGQIIPDQIIKVGREINTIAWDGSKAGLDFNEKISLDNIMVGLMLASGNDAAVTLARHFGRSMLDSEAPSSDTIDKAGIKKFISMMNERAVELGAEGTHFINPHGYHDNEHFTTAKDLSIFTAEAMKSDYFRNIVSIYSLEYPDWNQTKKDNPNEKLMRRWVNRNRLLKTDSMYYYPEAIGVKTGYTSKAGNCLISAAQRDGITVISVVLKSSKSGQWYDSKKLLKYGLDRLEYQYPILDDFIYNTIDVVGGEDDKYGFVDINPMHDISVVVDKNSESIYDYKLVWDETLIDPDNPKDIILKAPVEKGMIVGEVLLLKDGEVVGNAPLVTKTNVSKALFTPNPAHSNTPTPTVKPTMKPIMDNFTGWISDTIPLVDIILKGILVLIALYFIIWIASNIRKTILRSKRKKAMKNSNKRRYR